METEAWGREQLQPKNVRPNVYYCTWEHVSECVRVWMCVFPHVGRGGEGESGDAVFYSSPGDVHGHREACILPCFVKETDQSHPRA